MGDRDEYGCTRRLSTCDCETCRSIRALVESHPADCRCCNDYREALHGEMLIGMIQLFAANGRPT